MPVAHLPGVALYYEQTGAGIPILTLNGSATDLRQHPGPLDWPLTERFGVVAYDHRGLGQSEPTDAERTPTMADFGADALALADHLDLDRFGVIGVSFGGMVAQELALIAADRITRLVLCCTSSGGAGGASYPLHELWDRDDSERLESMVALIDTRAADDPAFGDAMRAFTSRTSATPTTAPPGAVRQLDARSRHDTWDRLPAISVPTLVAAGRYDGIAPLANSEALASRIPTATLQVFDGGHGFFGQDPTAWPAIIEFLSA